MTDNKFFPSHTPKDSNVDPQPAWRQRSGKRAALLIKLLLLQGVVFALLLLVFVSSPDTDPNHRAIIHMSTFALWFCWIGVCGSLIYIFKDPIKEKVAMSPKSWMLKFMLMAIALMLLSEVFTVTATNMYSIFGGEYGEAFITASDDYFETVLLASAIVIWPGFLLWALWLRRYDFHPNWVLVLFGLSGLISEILYGGLQQVYGIGMWVMTYGLFIYLPAYCLPVDRGARRPRLIHYVLPLFLVFLFQLPMVAIVLLVRGIIGHSFPFAGV